MTRLRVLAAVALAVGACAAPAADPPPIAVAPIAVAPGIAFALPPPAALGRSEEAQQLVTAHYRDQTTVFETRISVTPQRLLVVGTDMLGRRAMTIVWDGVTLQADAASWVPPNLRARNIVADIVLLHWPQAAVRAGLTPNATMRDAAWGVRTIGIAGQDMIRIERTGGAPGGWNGNWRYRNLAWGYELDIQSSETAP